MDIRQLRSVQKRLEEFVGAFRPILGRSERRHWCTMYLCGLMLDGERKSIEPVSKRLPGGNDQALQQFVNQSPWNHTLVMEKLADEIMTKLQPSKGILILDDTSLPKKGEHSVGVARQYCGALGKVANCQSIVSWQYYGSGIHFPVTGELYLPREWTDDVPRMKKAGVPPERMKFVEKWKLALVLLDAIRGKMGHEVLVFDAGYGEIRPFLAELDNRKEPFIGQIPESHSFWPENIGVVTSSLDMGRPRIYPKVADKNAKPLTAKQWGERLLKDGVGWEDVVLPLKKKRRVKVVAIRVREVNARAYYRPGPIRWLVIERLSDGSHKYYVSSLPEDTPLKQIVVWAHQRWVVEQGYQQLKEELGLDHFEGRSWTGLHHHLALCFMAYCFLLLLGRGHQKKLRTDSSSGAKVAERPVADHGMRSLRESHFRTPPNFLQHSVIST